jgi:hypothetical protein
MTATEVAKAVIDWASETCPDLNSIYGLDEDQIRDALPIAFAVMAEEADSGSRPDLGLEITDLGIDQAVLHTVGVSIELLVDDDEEATEKLEGFVAALLAAKREEMKASGSITLGGRVQGASPFMTASYEPPFAVFDDATKARRASFSLTVAELL